MVSNMSDLNDVSEWNGDIADSLIPNNIILIVYMLLGIIGNSYVLFVYRFRFSKDIGDRYFVPFLAISDMLASMVCGSFGIASNVMQAAFYNTHLCKSWWFFAAFITFLSICTLLIIAVQRYMRIVKPHGKQLDLKLCRISYICAVAFSFLCAVPTTYFYGSVSFPKVDGNVIGRRCSKIKGKDKIGSVVYISLIGIVTVLIIGSLVGIYIKIGRTIFLHMRYSTKQTDTDSHESSSKTLSDGDEITVINKANTDKNTTFQTSSDGYERGTTHCRQNCGTLQNNHGDRHEKINQRIIHKFTLMFMLITIIFLICYVPKVVIMLIEALNPKFWEGFSNTGRSAVLFVYRIYIINNISNPIVYAFLDSKFQMELKKMWICKQCSNL